MKDSPLLHALIATWREGAVVAGSSAGAMVLSDPMVDPRGGAFTVGLGLVRALAVVPHHSGELTAQLRRTLALTPPGCALVALGERTALVRESDGTWRHEGAGSLEVFVDGASAGIESLAGKPVS
jgi:cyanophycinase